MRHRTDCSAGNLPAQRLNARSGAHRSAKSPPPVAAHSVRHRTDCSAGNLPARRLNACSGAHRCILDGMLLYGNLNAHREELVLNEPVYA